MDMVSWKLHVCWYVSGKPVFLPSGLKFFLVLISEPGLVDGFE